MAGIIGLHDPRLLHAGLRKLGLAWRLSKARKLVRRTKCASYPLDACGCAECLRVFLPQHAPSHALAFSSVAHRPSWLMEVARLDGPFAGKCCFQAWCHHRAVAVGQQFQPSLSYAHRKARYVATVLVLASLSRSPISRTDRPLFMRSAVKSLRNVLHGHSPRLLASCMLSLRVSFKTDGRSAATSAKQ